MSFLKDIDWEKFDEDAAAELDRRGILPAPGEELADFASRLGRLRDDMDEFELELERDGRVGMIGLTMRAEDRIPDVVMAEARDKNQSLYGFHADWVPGFFMSKSLGLLWGGCSLSFPDDNFSIFLIRASFAKTKKWFIYDRAELLAHELCHVARAPLRDAPFEEHFAYQVSPSALRRKLGNCFQSPLDAIMFLAPIMLLLAAQTAVSFFGVRMPLWPFVAAAFAYPVFLLSRNHHYRRLVLRAETNLATIGVNLPTAVLFRCIKAEIEVIAKSTVDELRKWLAKRRNGDLRWRVIHKKFIDGEETRDDDAKTVD